MAQVAGFGAWKAPATAEVESDRVGILFAGSWWVGPRTIQNVCQEMQKATTVEVVAFVDFCGFGAVGCAARCKSHRIASLTDDGSGRKHKITLLGFGKVFVLPAIPTGQTLRTLVPICQCGPVLGFTEHSVGPS